MSDGGSLAEVAQMGDRARTLQALRDRLARQIDATSSARDVAVLSARLTEVLEQLAGLPAATEGTALDELARRRASGDGVAARPVRSARR